MAVRLGDDFWRLGRYLAAAEGDAIGARIDHNRIPISEFPLENRQGKRIGDQALQGPFQRAGAIVGVVPFGGKILLPSLAPSAGHDRARAVFDNLRSSTG
jgi:hypothetical protein